LIAYRKIDAHPDEIIWPSAAQEGQGQGTLSQDRHPPGPGHQQGHGGLPHPREKGTIRSAAIALVSVAPTPVRLAEVEAFLVGKKLSPKLIDEAEALAQATVKPIDDIRSTRNTPLGLRPAGPRRLENCKRFTIPAINRLRRPPGWAMLRTDC
jgi:hypothetical protein